jgi:HD-like signal output (HDOD) protein
MGDPFYRARQFWRAARAVPLSRQEIERVRTVLNEDALALYQTMPPGDLHHALDIHDALVGQGYTATPLLQAALLHDVAKRQVGLAHRTGVILLNKLSPDALKRAASADTRSWRFPFHVSLHHPEIGAALAAHAGVDERALELIRAHQERTYLFTGEHAAQLREWHALLQALDDVN